MKVRLVVISVLAAVLVALPSGAFGSPARVMTNSKHFADSVGEDAKAPDITGIDVANTDAGVITFHIKISNRPAMTPDMVVLIWMDTDGKQSTGDPDVDGADYTIELDPGAVGLFKWNGTTYVSARSQSSLAYQYDATGATITVSAADLGSAKKVNFVVAAVSGIVDDASGNPDFTNAHADVAPDSGHGLYAYTVITKLTLTATGFTTFPKPSKHGKRFTAVLAANESDTSGLVTSGTVTCSATITGVRIAEIHSLANGVASCSWNLPPSSKGKTLAGTISITVRGTTLTKRFSARIT